MTNRSLESTIDLMVEIVENPSNVYGDLQKIGNLALNLKSQLKIAKIGEPKECDN